MTAIDPWEKAADCERSMWIAAWKRAVADTTHLAESIACCINRMHVELQPAA
jgi:hypothetical protein